MEIKTKLPAFKGKPLIEIPETISQIGFLEGNFGEAFFEEYQGRVKVDYNGNPNLDVLSYRDGVVKGSNSFVVALANQILREEGLRTATQADLERVIKTNAFALRGTYKDTGLVLRSEEGYDGDVHIVRGIALQIRERGMEFSPENPVMIPLTGLELETADNQYGLTFRLRENAEVYVAPILNKEGKFSSGDIDLKIGLPVATGNLGDRTLYTRGSSLSRLVLVFDLSLGSVSRNLGVSGDDGRVVAVSGEATCAEDRE